MDDKQIVELYWERSEHALLETKHKYGRYANYIAFNILRNREDSEECVNSSYLRLWDNIPPHKPENLATYLGKIVRNLSLDMYEKCKAKKRGAGQISLALDELKECLPSSDCMENIIDKIILKEKLNDFLGSLSKDTRLIFVRRYWYLTSIKEIAKEYQISESKVKMTLLRTREKLKQYLEQEGIY